MAGVTESPGMDLMIPAFVEDAPVVPLGESDHGARFKVVCVGCRQDVTISHGIHAPSIDLGAYRCLRCRSHES